MSNHDYGERESYGSETKLREVIDERVADTPDIVNHPPHYTRGKVETMDGLESAVEGLQGKEAGLTWQVIKYMWRWKFKSNPLEDLRKAEFYLNRLIKHVEEDKNGSN